MWSWFRKKPGPVGPDEVAVIVQAMQWDGANAADLAAWMGAARTVDVSEIVPQQPLAIPTRQGVLRAAIGDWIIWNHRGEFSSCPPDPFAATYESDPGPPWAEIDWDAEQYEADADPPEPSADGSGIEKG